MLKEQFLSICHEDLATFLRERMPEHRVHRENGVKCGTVYVDAHACTLGSKTRKKDLQCKPSVIKPKLGNDADSFKVQGGSLGWETAGKGRWSVSYATKLAIMPKRRYCRPSRRLGGAQVNIGDGILKVKPANEEKVPLASGMGQLPENHNMPIRKGYVGDQRVEVLRDTGCSSAAIRVSLVRAEQMTGEVHTCVLTDGTLRKFPLAKVQVDTPYYVGKSNACVWRSPFVI